MGFSSTWWQILSRSLCCLDRHGVEVEQSIPHCSQGNQGVPGLSAYQLRPGHWGDQNT